MIVVLMMEPEAFSKSSADETSEDNETIYESESDYYYDDDI